MIEENLKEDENNIIEKEIKTDDEKEDENNHKIEIISETEDNKEENNFITENKIKTDDIKESKNEQKIESINETENIIEKEDEKKIIFEKPTEKVTLINEISEKNSLIEEKNEKIIEKETENQTSKSNNLSELRLSCPKCNLIPAIFFDMNSKNIYQVSSGCENKHLITNMPVKDYYKKSVKTKTDSKNYENDYICSKHNLNYMGFCKACQKNICGECLDKEHNGHYVIKFINILPSNEEIIQLKNSIDNEKEDIDVFLMEEFHKWINELQSKFYELEESIKYKNKLYNFIINNYETKEFNYQSIYNIKVVMQNQMRRNLLTKKLQSLKTLLQYNNSEEKKDDLDIKKINNTVFKAKTEKLMEILDITKSTMNDNYKFIPFETNSDQNLMNFLNKTELEKKKELNNSIKNSIQNSLNVNNNTINNNIINDDDEFVTVTPSNLDQLLEKEDQKNMSTVVINPYLNNNFEIQENNNINNININKISINSDQKNPTLSEKLEFANEIKLPERKLNQTIPINSIIYSLTVLIDPYTEKPTNKFAASFENGNINIYNIDQYTNKIYLDFEIKEHKEAVTYITCLHDGRLVTCSQDNTMKIIEITYSYIWSFWARYYVIQTLTRIDKDPKILFHPVSIIEMNNTLLISADWKHILIWKLKKQTNEKNKNIIISQIEEYGGYDTEDIKKNRYNYQYEIIEEININTAITSLIQIDEKTILTAHYGPGIVTFYDIINRNSKSLNGIKCVDSAVQCMTIIKANTNIKNKWEKDKIVIIGGYGCVYLVSVKEQNLIDKINLPDNDYVKCIINSGIREVSNGFICGGYYGQFSHDIVHYNTKSSLGFSELIVNEINRLQCVDKGAINAMIKIKKNQDDLSCNQKNIIIITGGFEQNLKSYCVE